MSAVDLGGALDATPAAVADLVGDIDIPCEARHHAVYGGGRVTHLARGRFHEGCRIELRATCEGCLTNAQAAITTLRLSCRPLYCRACQVVACTHNAALDVHPIECAS